MFYLLLQSALSHFEWLLMISTPSELVFCFFFFKPFCFCLEYTVVLCCSRSSFLRMNFGGMENSSQNHRRDKPSRKLRKRSGRFWCMFSPCRRGIWTVPDDLCVCVCVSGRLWPFAIKQWTELGWVSVENVAPNKRHRLCKEKCQWSEFLARHEGNKRSRNLNRKRLFSVYVSKRIKAHFKC